MSGETELKIDPKVITDERFVSDQKLKQMLKQGSSATANPNPKKYTDCRIEFSKTGITYEPALKTIKPFEYDKKLDEKFETNPYIGPYSVAGENSIYVGQMKGDVREGRGMSIFFDGNIYEGYFEKDRTSIRGRLLFDNGDVFMGEIKDMCMSGQGVYYNNSLGSKYTGMFKEDAPHGQGKEEWEDGTHYQGAFVQGSKEGFGVFRTKEGSVYEGEFTKGMFEGKGTLTTISKTKYVGVWKASELRSPAEIVYDDGKKYKGDVNKEMKPHGNGFIESLTKKYIGVFKNGSLDGLVETVYPNGEKRKSMYNNGVFVKWIEGGPDNDSSKQENIDLSDPPRKKVDKVANQSNTTPVMMANPKTPAPSQNSVPGKPGASSRSDNGQTKQNGDQEKKKFCFC